MVGVKKPVAAAVLLLCVIPAACGRRSGQPLRRFDLNGRLIRLYRGNEWTPAEVIAQIRQAVEIRAQ
jgi:hypothetical protein